MNDEQIKKLINDASIDTLAERIKESPMYPTYQRAVKKGEKALRSCSQRYLWFKHL
jgi:hypothetical protein